MALLKGRLRREALNSQGCDWKQQYPGEALGQGRTAQQDQEGRLLHDRYADQVTTQTWDAGWAEGPPGEDIERLLKLRGDKGTALEHEYGRAERISLDLFPGELASASQGQRDPVLLQGKEGIKSLVIVPYRKVASRVP